MAAAHLLFFLCVPACPSGCECTSLLAGCGLLAKQWRSPHVQFAVQVASALAAWDWAAFLQLRMRIPPSLACPRTRQAASAASYSPLPPASPAAHDSGSVSQVAAWRGSLTAVSGSARAREGSRCHQQGSWLLMEILDTRLPAVQHAAVRALAAAYRSLPVSAALVLTGLVQGACTTAQENCEGGDELTLKACGHLLALMSKAASEGHRGAAFALAHLPRELAAEALVDARKVGTCDTPHHKVEYHVLQLQFKP
ncbi:hypothetical protein HaLaN_29032 [Haematococcus lacustris]|uniref:Uncharacterized protein n=1 Tax=Haematococcus lacustris TaxID=44745 RepID=A0A6A0ABV2_HAELA|nr:hypothetical protein HaLaN_29032 [Haematococcus lacustris]